MVPVCWSLKGPLTIIYWDLWRNWFLILSRTHQNRTILSEPPVTKIWRLGKTSRVLTKSSWASGVEDISLFVYVKTITISRFCLWLWRHETYDCIPELDWLMWRCYIQMSVREEWLGYVLYLIPSTTYQNFFVSWSYLSITERKTGNGSSMTFESGKRFSSL